MLKNVLEGLKVMTIVMSVVYFVSDLALGGLGAMVMLWYILFVGVVGGVIRTLLERRNASKQ